jgi:hypothetical protein
MPRGEPVRGGRSAVQTPAAEYSSSNEPPDRGAIEAGSPKQIASTWEPLRNRVFLALWVASLASNIGSWMHVVAAAWLMTSLTASATLVALLQTANAAPAFLFALPAGALADVLEAISKMPQENEG